VQSRIAILCPGNIPLPRGDAPVPQPCSRRLADGVRFSVFDLENLAATLSDSNMSPRTTRIFCFKESRISSTSSSTLGRVQEAR
jgi:hypothetical protein